MFSLWRLIGTAVLATTVNAQQPPKPSLEAQMVALSKKVADLESKVAKMTELVESVMGVVLDLDKRTSAAAALNPNDMDGFTAAWTGCGPIMITLRKVEPFLTGYRLSFEARR